MAATIKTKIRTTTGGTASTTAGELCVNTYDKKIFIGDGAASVELANQIGYNTITTLGTISTGTWSATAIDATKGGTGQTTYATGDLIYSSASDTLSKLTKPAATTSFLQMTSAGVPSWQTTIPATAGGTGSTAAFTANALVYASSTSVLTTGTIFGITSSTNTSLLKIAMGASPKNLQYFSVTESLLDSSATLGLETDASPGIPATTSSAYLNLASSQATSSIYMSASTGNDVTISAGGSGTAFSMVASASELYGTLVGVVKVVDDVTSPYVLFGDDGSISGGDHCLIKMEALTAILTIDSTTVQIYTTTPVAGKVLTCMDGSGTASWETLTFSEPTSSPSISTGTLVLDLSVSRVFTVSLNASVTTLTISNTPATASMSQNFTLILTADGTARTITWPASVKWANNDAPSLTSTNAKKDILSFVSTDAGTTWYGFIGGLNF